MEICRPISTTASEGNRTYSLKCMEFRCIIYFKAYPLARYPLRTYLTEFHTHPETLNDIHLKLWSGHSFI